MQLNRDVIVQAAIEILDTYGLNDMTMRRVATQLSVAPGALYWHISNKQELIHAIADDILSPVLGAEARTPKDPQELCETLEELLLAHRDGAELIASALAQPSSSLRADVEKLLATTLKGQGVGDTTAETAARGLLHLLLGAGMQQQMQQQFAETLGEGETEAAGDAVRGDVSAQVELLLRAVSGRQ